MPHHFHKGGRHSLHPEPSSSSFHHHHHHHFRHRRRRSFCCCSLGAFCCALTFFLAITTLVSVWIIGRPSKRAEALMKRRDAYHCEPGLKTDRELILDSPFAKRNKIDCRLERFLLATNGSCSEQIARISAGPPTNYDSVLDYRRVVLVISHNNSRYESILHQHQLYHGIFFKIIHCVASVKAVMVGKDGDKNFVKLLNRTIVEFGDVPKQPVGSLSYLCLLLVHDIFVIKSRYKIDGILQINGDVVPNLWRFRRGYYDLKSNWLLADDLQYDVKSGKKCAGISWNNAVDCWRKEPWHVWLENRPNAAVAIDELENHHSDFAKQLAAINHGDSRIRRTRADFYYVTRKSLPEVVELFRLFARHKVNVEFVVGTVLRGLGASNSDNKDPIMNSEENDSRHHPLQLVPRINDLSDHHRQIMANWQQEATGPPSSPTHRRRFWIYRRVEMSRLWSLEDQCLYCRILQRINKLRKRHSFVC